MTKYLNTKAHQKDKESPPAYSPAEEWSISIACITFFPLLYIIGKSISSWIN